MRKANFNLICGIVVLLLLFTACSKDRPKYAELFTHVEEHRAVFMLPREEGLAALKITDGVGEYDTTLGTIMQDDILTVNQMEFIQQVVVDVETNKIIGYRVGTVVPRSESGYQEARELVRAFLDQYKPVEEEADKVEKSVQKIDRMALPLKPLTGAIEESWSYGKGEDKLYINYRMSNSFQSDNELPLNLYFSSYEGK
ncbi:MULTISPECIES: hypothetical protein [Paenibacillus]|uniref:Lipoprotein n=1 Tax=Paenibacillus odorifer TaxID=189426 RepID=A0A1R0XUN6_9BACL|nr:MULTISPECIES: hypothetical protein [Paenibacillus]AIQ33834.1 hypothetical protein R50345_03710 [Paenibacillus sp. FSL R5-0345]OMD38795.1 hypothetical protein BSK52_17915 [Paenibacillus odorifer]